MRVKEVHTVISTNNWARYTIETFGHGIIYSRVSYSELPARIKNAKVWLAYPVELSSCSVTHWKIKLCAGEGK